ncbi:MAG: triose-phosphate isomerase [Flavobacteriaceae bacterium]|nr:triose-phosphate isomerase [Flavobacteriaceae bacterium]
MSRKKIIAGNWKMNNDLNETQNLLNNLISMSIPNDVKIMIAPSYVNLKYSVDNLKSSEIEVISQNIHQSDKGAYTGEISASMLKSIGVNSTIIGHSERREYFKETHDILKLKVDNALKNSMNIIFCFGEELKDRKNNNHFDIISKQISESLFHLDNKFWNNIVLAYEPVWAIGTGETASSEQVQEMHFYIREFVCNKYDQLLSDNLSILYGGSVKPTNAKEIFSMSDVDGGLIGGASLNAEDFFKIINSFN